MVPERRLIDTAAEQPKVRAKVRPKPQMRTFYLRWCVTVVVAILAVSRFAAAAQVGYAIDRTQAQLQVAQAQELALQGQVSALTSAGRLTSIASKLNLAPAPPVLSVTVPASSAGAVRQPAGSGGRKSGAIAAVGALIESITRAVTGM